MSTIRSLIPLRGGVIEPLQSSRPPAHSYLIHSHVRSLHTTRRRKLHSTRRPEAAAPTLFESEYQHGILDTTQHQVEQPVSDSLPSPLSKLPTSSLIRSILIQQASSIPTLLTPSIAVLSYFATAKSALFSPDRNLILKRLLKPLLYNQFCAGENAQQVTSTANGLKSWGVQGILLGWAREVEFRKSKGIDVAKVLATQLAAPGAREAAKRDIREWGQGTLKTVRIASPGDLVSLKFSGAGALVLDGLCHPENQHDPLFTYYLHEVCKLAKTRGISLAIDAEQQRIQPGIDALALDLSRKYNGRDPGTATVKNTYQAYLKSTPSKLSADLALAANEGWALGAKLVRGAYLASEERNVIWATKEGTDAAYDGLAEGLMRRNWAAGGYLHAPTASAPPFPHVDLVLATHNLASVQHAIRIRQSQAARGLERIQLVYAQLMGMADHVSAAAIQAGNEAEAQARSKAKAGMGVDAAVGGQEQVEVPRVYKYLVWGSVQECMRYLVRRAEENRDAAGRTRESRAVLWGELRRRVVGW